MGPNSRKVMKNELFRDLVNDVGRHAYDAVIKPVEKLWGKNRS